MTEIKKVGHQIKKIVFYIIFFVLKREKKKYLFNESLFRVRNSLGHGVKINIWVILDAIFLIVLGEFKSLEFNWSRAG